MPEAMNEILDFGFGAVLLTKAEIQRIADERAKRGELDRAEAERRGL